MTPVIVKVTDPIVVGIEALDTVHTPTTEVRHVAEPRGAGAPSARHVRVRQGAVGRVLDPDRDPRGPVLALDRGRAVEVADVHRVRGSGTDVTVIDTVAVALPPAPSLTV